MVEHLSPWQQGPRVVGSDLASDTQMCHLFTGLYELGRVIVSAVRSHHSPQTMPAHKKTKKTKQHNMACACRKLAEARSSIVLPPPTSPHQALQGWLQHSYKNVSDSFEKRDRSFRNVSCDAASVDVMPRVATYYHSLDRTEPNDDPGSVVVKALAIHHCSERPWVQISFLDILYVTPVAGLGVRGFFWVLRFPPHSLFH